MRLILLLLFLQPLFCLTQVSSAQDSISTIFDLNSNDSLRLAAFRSWRDQVQKTDRKTFTLLNDTIIYLCTKNLDGQTANTNYEFFALSLADAWYIKAKTSFENNDLTESLALFKRSLGLYNTFHQTHGEVLSLNEMGLVLIESARYDEALIHFNRCISLCEIYHHYTVQASALSNISTAYQYQGNYARALQCLFLSADLERAQDNKRGLAATLGNIGIIYRFQGDYHRAIDYYRQSYDLYYELGNKRGTGIALNNMANIYKDQGNTEKAIELYLESLAIKESEGDKKGIAVSLANIAAVYGVRGEFQNALLYYTRSLDLRKESGNKIAISFAKIGLGAALLDVGQYEAAKQEVHYSYAVGRETGNHAVLKRSVVLLYEINSRLNLVDSAYFYLQLLLNETKKELDVNYFTMTEHEKELYFPTVENDFGMLYDFIAHHPDSFPGSVDSAYNMALQNKGLSLKSTAAMRSAVLSSNDSSLIEKYEHWISIKRKIATNYASGSASTDLENKATEIERELVKLSSAFSDFDRTKNFRWQQIRDHLKPGECAIEFIHYKSTIDSTHPVLYAALLIKPDSEHPTYVSVCSETDLAKIFNVSQGTDVAAVSTIYGTTKSPNFLLYETIWKPLETSLANTTTVFYSPSGLLHKVSFHSIRKSQNALLSDLYSFRQLSSTANVVLAGNSALEEKDAFLLMGGITYNSDTSQHEIWPYLSGTLHESDAIYNYLLKKKFAVSYHKGQEATEGIFKKNGNKNIVHIATHGFFYADPELLKKEMTDHQESNQDLIFRGRSNYANWSFVNNKNPLMRSGIVLANANDVWQRDPLTEGEDGVLTAQEVSTLDLRNTKLVVLSACETGLGDIKGSEGVFGLQRAFKMAGVKYLIMSLWQVPDKETSEFMILFYKNLIKLKDIPTAFNKTQKVMREKYDPYYWGAFVLIE